MKHTKKRPHKGHTQPRSKQNQVLKELEETSSLKGQRFLGTLRLLGQAELEALGDEALGELLTEVAGVEEWIRDVRDYAYEGAVQSGRTYKGWKLVAGRNQRKYTDPHAVAKALQSAGYEDVLIYEKSLRSIATMEKLLGKQELQHVLGSLITKGEIKPQLVPETDKRPALMLQTTLHRQGESR